MRKKHIPVKSASCQVCLEKNGGIFFRYPEKCYGEDGGEGTLLFIKYYSSSSPRSIPDSPQTPSGDYQMEQNTSGYDSALAAGSQEEQSLGIKNSKRKVCSSCGTRKTPYWRDGWESGILLCNACGIRYQKYKKFCAECCTIARKDEKGRLHCPDCQIRL